jgi:hypothetical protein
MCGEKEWGEGDGCGEFEWSFWGGWMGEGGDWRGYEGGKMSGDVVRLFEGDGEVEMLI